MKFGKSKRNPKISRGVFEALIQKGILPFALCFILAIVYIFFASPSNTSGLSGAVIIGIIVLYTFTHWISVVFLLPRFLVYSSRKGFSVFVCFVLAGICANIVATAVRYAIFPMSEPILDPILFRLISVFLTANILSIPGWIYAYFLTKHRLTSVLQSAGIPVSATQNTTSVDNLQKLLPLTKRGHVIYLRALGGYTEVHTSGGVHTLRAGVGEVEKMTTASGLRIHKSYWVNNSEMVKVLYHNGNPQVALRSGEVLPLSRGMVAAVNAIIRDMELLGGDG